MPVLNIGDDLQKVLGHTEDALAPILNNYYILSAHIIPEFSHVSILANY